MAILVTREPHCLEALLQARQPAQLKRPNRRWWRRQPAATWSRWPAHRKLPFMLIPWNERRGGGEARRSATAGRARDRFRRAGAVHEDPFAQLSSGATKTRSSTSIPRCCRAFPGAQAYRQAYEHGVKDHGCDLPTSSACTWTKDPLLRKRSFTIHPDWTLKEIVAAGQGLETQVLVVPSSFTWPSVSTSIGAR